MVKFVASIPLQDWPRSAVHRFVDVEAIDVSFLGLHARRPSILKKALEKGPLEALGHSEVYVDFNYYDRLLEVLSRHGAHVTVQRNLVKAGFKVYTLNYSIWIDSPRPEVEKAIQLLIENARALASLHGVVAMVGGLNEDDARRMCRAMESLGYREISINVGPAFKQRLYRPAVGFLRLLDKYWSGPIHVHGAASPSAIAAVILAVSQPVIVSEGYWSNAMRYQIVDPETMKYVDFRRQVPECKCRFCSQPYHVRLRNPELIAGHNLLMLIKTCNMERDSLRRIAERLIP